MAGNELAPLIRLLLIAVLVWTLIWLVRMEVAKLRIEAAIEKALPQQQETGPRLFP